MSAVKAEPFDRQQEQRLLHDWTRTVQFDRLPDGIPPLDDEQDDED